MTDSNFERNQRPPENSRSLNGLGGDAGAAPDQLNAAPPAPPSGPDLMQDTQNVSGSVARVPMQGNQPDEALVGRVIHVTNDLEGIKEKKRPNKRGGRGLAGRKNAVGRSKTPGRFGSLDEAVRDGAGGIGGNGEVGSWARNTGGETTRPEALSGPAGGSRSSAVDGARIDSQSTPKTADPLLRRPRISGIVLCALLAVVYFAAAAGVYWVGVRTPIGQNYDDMVWTGLRDNIPGWLTAASILLSREIVVPIVGAAMAVAAFVIMAIRRRWWLIGQGIAFGMACYAAAWLKRLLPRPALVHVHSQVHNSAPSGHTILAVGAGIILLFSVPRVWRAFVAVIGGAYSATVAVSLIVGRWHRPSDVLMSLLLACGLAFLTLAFTRSSGMDEPGKRVSSASIQIAASVMITFGLLFTLYGGFVLWNILPGLDISAMWASSGAYSSSRICIVGLASLSFGLLLAVRHLTAAPLSKIGLIGAPPAPPQLALR